MKVDMRAPMDGQGEYLLSIEAETDLESTALAHFSKAHDETFELRVVFRVPNRAISGWGSRRGGEPVKAVYLAWDERKEFAKPAETPATPGEPNG
jgi:hypothetical protein